MERRTTRRLRRSERKQEKSKAGKGCSNHQGPSTDSVPPAIPTQGIDVAPCHKISV
jgi:hypothetical protein